MNVLALCSGIGGIELGLRLAEPTARTVCYVEREAFPVAIALARIREGYLDDAPIWSDVRTFDGKPWRGVVDCITGGYPCQPFSYAGSRKGEDDPRHLWPHIARILEAVRPRFCFFENVAGHLDLGYREVRSRLEALHYAVAEGLFTAAEVGAPHKRQRLFILADRTNVRREGTEPQRQQVCECQHASDEGGYVGNSDEPRPQGRGGPQRQSGYELPAWPAGPADSDAWAEILRREPGLEPAVRRVADGLPARVDRLSALGNAVVPAVAATAWRQLRKGAVSGSR